MSFEVVWGSATKALYERFSLEVIAYFPKKFDSPCHLKCCQTPQKCPNTKRLRKLLHLGNLEILTFPVRQDKPGLKGEEKIMSP
jgi:hypothetical protein